MSDPTASTGADDTVAYLKAKKEYLELDEKGAAVRKVTKEGTITDLLHLLDF